MRPVKSSVYRWVILAVCFMMVFVCLGFCSGNKGMYLGAITEALGIKRSLFSLNDTCRYVASTVVALFFGALFAKFGVRKLVAFGFACIIGSTLLYTYAERIGVFCVGGALLGTGLIFTTTNMASVIVRRWFPQNVGTYTGIVLAANGLGGAVAAQIISPLINEEGNAFGYRNAYKLTILILLVVGTLTVLLLREKPSDSPDAPAAPGKKRPKVAPSSGVRFETVKTRPIFYATAGMILMTGFLLQSIAGVYVAYMKNDVGLDPAYVATVVSVHALALTAAKFGVGFLYDKKGLQWVMLLCQGAMAVSFGLMAAISNSASGKVYAMLFGIIYSVALPLETVTVPLIVNDLYGSASYEKILGIMLAVNSAGFAIGTPVINLCFERFGSYRPILIVYIGVTAVLVAVGQAVIRSAEKEKAQILQAEQAAAPSSDGDPRAESLRKE